MRETRAIGAEGGGRQHAARSGADDKGDATRQVASEMKTEELHSLDAAIDVVVEEGLAELLEPAAAQQAAAAEEEEAAAAEVAAAEAAAGAERGGGMGLGVPPGLKLDLRLVGIGVDGLQLIDGERLCGSVRLTTDGVEVSDGATPCGTPAVCVPQAVAQLASPTDGKWFESKAAISEVTLTRTLNLTLTLALALTLPRCSTSQRGCGCAGCRLRRTGCTAGGCWRSARCASRCPRWCTSAYARALCAAAGATA